MDGYLIGAGFHFNSRPHGGRRWSLRKSADQLYFNSRPHGGRLPYGNGEQEVYVFQLTPSRRATETVFFTPLRRKISTHALTEGDDTEGIVAVLVDISTHALTEGDMWMPIPRNIPLYFNSRPHGGRPQI